MGEPTRLALGLVFIVGSIAAAFGLLWIGANPSARPTLEVDPEDDPDEFWKPRPYGHEGH